MDRLGTTHYLTDNVDGKVTSFVSYDDWGALTSKAVVRVGARELDLVQNYTGHPADMVLGVYYAKARMYDAGDRRFLLIDAKKDLLNWYIYSNDNPIRFIDLTGYYAADGSDERFKEENPIVYQAITDLSITWTLLDKMQKAPNVSPDIKNNIESDKLFINDLCNVVREIGDTITVKSTKVNFLWESHELNPTEAVLYANNPVHGTIALIKAVDANLMTGSIYGDGYEDYNNANAFRHAYWSASMVIAIDEEYVKYFTDAHEYGFPANFTGEFYYRSTIMDLENNEIGREIAKNVNYNYTLTLNSIIMSIDNGVLTRLVNNELVSTDSSRKIPGWERVLCL